MKEAGDIVQPMKKGVLKKNGVRTIALLSGGFSELALEEAGAIAIYHSVSDLYEHYDESPLMQG